MVYSNQVRSSRDVDTSVEMEALERLRREIDAAFEAQQRPNNRQKQVELPSETLAPKWARVTALLASVGRPAVKNSSISAPLTSIKRFNYGEKQREMTESERRNLLRRVVAEWQRTSHAAATVTRLFVRARRRGERCLVADVLSAWRCRVIYHRRLKAVAGLVKKQGDTTMLTALWTRWTCEQHRAKKVREFRLRRRKRWSCEVFCTWILVTEQRAMYRRYKQKAARQLLRRYWRWLLAGIEAQRVQNDRIERFGRHQVKNLLEYCFLLWGEYVEQRKQWQFAVRWSDRRVLGDAYDLWRDVHDHTRSMRHALQLATRRRRRRLFNVVLRVWSNYAHLARKRKQALVMIVHKQHCRAAFVQLKFNAQYERVRECSFQMWKSRRAVWTWLRRSHQARMLRLRAAFLKENHDRLMLRSAVWGPWRRIFLRSITLRTFTSRRRAAQLRSTWAVFVAALDQQGRDRLVLESIIDRREVRQLRDAIAAWRLHVNFVRQRRALISKAKENCRRKLIREVWSFWKVAHDIVRREKRLDAIATKHLASKTVRHWTRWAYWSRRELTRKIAAVVERRQQRQTHQCIDHWRLVVHERHKELCGTIFNLWKSAVEVQHRKRQLQILRRCIQLRRRWQRWRLHVVHCQQIRSIASKAQKLRELRLLKYSFITVWFRKTRNYIIGSTLLKGLSEKHLLRCILTRWRENQLRLNAIRRADAFHSRKLQYRYLSKLHALTVGRSRIAASCARHRRLATTWSYWRQYFAVKQRRREADSHFLRRSKKKAIHSLQIAATSAIMRRNQQIEAEAWHEAVLLQSVLGKWLIVARHRGRCRLLEQQLSWIGAGRRAFRLWQDAMSRKHHLLIATQFHSMILLKRSWNALLCVTKRRQVALVMWSHAMKRIRSANVFLAWKNVIEARRGQYAVAAAMNCMQLQRTRQRLFTAWIQLVQAGRLAARLEKQESLRWRQVCWAHWKLWRVSCRWQRSEQRSLLRKTFYQGLRRHAIQQQACREVCVRTARNVLHRCLVRWRVELWLVLNQKKMVADAKRKALTHWKAYIAACHQKRRWEHYVQQLHRSETRTKAVEIHKTRKAGTFHDTRALQAQLKRNRVLMTHVLHAWYLVVQNHRRRLQNRSLALKKSRRRQVTERIHSNSNSRQEAVEFWAYRVMQRSFFTWREQSVGKAAELA